MVAAVGGPAVTKQKDAYSVDLDLLLVWTWAVVLTVTAVMASIQFLAKGTCSFGVMCWAIADIAGLWWSASRIKP